jgi:hypothetical protein
MAMQDTPIHAPLAPAALPAIQRAGLGGSIRTQAPNLASANVGMGALRLPPDVQQVTDESYAQEAPALPVRPSWGGTAQQQQQAATAAAQERQRASQEQQLGETNRRADTTLERLGAQAEEAARHNRVMENKPSGSSTVVVQGAEGPMWADKGGGARPILGPDGKPLGGRLSATERMDARKFSKAEPVMKAVSELSEKINTGQGAIAKITGGVARAAAQVNLNDDVAEYQSLVAGFTPLVARALGHTGVLTQQDVDSTREVFPKPGDSKSLRDRKIKRIMSLLGEIEDATSGQSHETPSAAGGPDLAGLAAGQRRRFTAGPFAGQIWMLGPDGTPQQVK